MKCDILTLCHKTSIYQLLFPLLLLYGGITVQGQNNFFNSNTNPVGIVNDAEGNVLMFHNILSGINISAYLSKYNSSGGLIDRIQIGATNEIGALGNIARIPGSNRYYAVSGNGNVYLVNGTPLSASLRFNIRNLNVDASNILDVFACNDPILPCIVGNLGGIVIPSSSTYGDIAIWPSGSDLQLFITGLNQTGIHPFIIRITINAVGSVTQAKVLAASSAEGAANDSGMGVERGIAINGFGVVCSSMTNARYNGTFYTGPFEDLIAFTVDFDPVANTIPATGPFYFAQDVYSKGMDNDVFGNFYVVTDPVGAISLGVIGEAAVAIIDKGLGAYYYAGATNNSSSSCRDISYDPANHRAYFTSYIPPTDEIDGTYWIDLSNLVPLSTGCHTFPELSLSAPIGSDGQYYANQTLTANSLINNDATVLFQAGSNIRLRPGFKVEAGVTLNAIIQSCFASPSTLVAKPINKINRESPMRQLSDQKGGSSSFFLKHSGLKVYPNPAKDVVNIQYSGDQQIQRIELFQANGQLVKTWEGSFEYSVFFSVEDLPKAVYYLKIHTQTTHWTQLLYKQ